MKNLPWLYAWRQLRLSKTRSLLVVLSIAIGIFAFAAIWGAASVLRRELPVRFQAIHPASAILHTSLFQDGMVDAVDRMSAVAAAEARLKAKVRYLDAADEWHDMELFALGDYLENRVDMVRPWEGAWPPAEREILIERNSLSQTGAALGGPITLETSEGEQRTLTISGLAHDMNQAPAQVTGVPYGYVSQDTLEWLGLQRGYNELHLIVLEDQYDTEHINQVAQEAADKFENDGKTVYWTEVPEPGTHFAQQFMPTILLILTSLGLMVLLMSSFLVINVITALLTQQIKQIGIMKSVGATPRQIAGLYFRLVIIYGVTAILLAIPLGALGSTVFATFLAAQLNFDIERSILVPSALVIELTVGLLVPIIAAMIPIRSAVNITVREAIQDQGLELSSAGNSHIDELLQTRLAALPIPRPMRLSIRNTFRRKGRLVRTLIPLMLGGAIFITVLTVRASLFSTLEGMLASQGFDVQIQLTRPQRIARLEAEASKVPEITVAEGWFQTEGIPIRADGSEGDSVIVSALPAGTQVLIPDMVAGRWLESEDTNAIVVPVSFLSGEPGLALGSEVTLNINDKETTWRIVGLNQVFQPPIAPKVLYVNLPQYWRLMGNTARANNLRILTKNHDAKTHAAAAQDIEQRLENADFEVSSTRTATEDRRVLTERFNIITVILMTMATLLATVGAVGLMGTMSINVLERTREIGVMRAIGASTRSVILIFVVEGLVIGMISWVGSLILSQPMSRLMSRTVGMTFAQLPLDYTFAWLAPILWIVIVLSVSAIASLIPARNAANLTVRDTLAYE
ncbi:MAG: FtsX-like permease family protein [Caldilineaceae bacterium]